MLDSRAMGPEKMDNEQQTIENLPQILKHLEFIQATIARLAQNSFTYKGWAITLVSAAFTVLGQEKISHHVLLIGLLPAIGFWVLDAQFLRSERLFRCLYNDVRLLKQTDFDMSTRPYDSHVPLTLVIMFTRSLAWLYLPLVLLIVSLWWMRTQGAI